ncbi:hypothetical protein [Actinoplanes aureus]|jgi:hypothetical protein|uniref:Uncharacterized protein n=1 Tax=Actinoplanes aureus TaxID=2792083 RepID=A0A931G4K0_9ACTN|nr:hypothetical protein [Actinoplanes aureus]MBG0568051.1 hypothetical protein [Actinoplanes aureus]
MNADNMISIARAEALFVSPVSVSDQLTRQQVTALVGRAVRTYHGVRGCAAEFAAAYAEHPDIAPSRMRWARSVIDTLYPVRVRAGATAMHDLAA